MVHEKVDTHNKLYGYDFVVPIKYGHLFSKIKEAIEDLINNHKTHKIMDKESELTVSTSLNQMYELALDNAIEIVRDEILESAIWHANLVNPVLMQIIDKLQNLKAKG